MEICVFNLAVNCTWPNRAVVEVELETEAPIYAKKVERIKKNSRIVKFNYVFILLLAKHYTSNLIIKQSLVSVKWIKWH